MSNLIWNLPTRRKFLATASAMAVFARTTFATTIAPPWPLWQVEGFGGRAFVLAESLPRRTDWNDARILALLAKSKRLWTETNQIFQEPAKVLVDRFAKITEGQHLPQLTPLDERRLAAAAKYCKVSLTDFAGMRPWLLAATLEDSFYSAAGLTGNSARTVLSSTAAKVGIPVSSEFAIKDDVFAFFGAMSPEQNLQFLRYIFDEVEMGPDGAEHISSAWANGDFRPATTVIETLRVRSPQLFQVLTADRNHKWVPRFVDALKSGKQQMFVLGLYHMVGDFGVPAELRRSGLQVTQI